MNFGDYEQIECFNTALDIYNGITIDSGSLPDDKQEFKENLEKLIKHIENNRKLIWIYVDIKKSNLIPVLTEKGFMFHSCNFNYVLLVKRISKNAVIPTVANHTLGVGAIVRNKQNQILVVKERLLNLGYKLPGGHIDDKEMISSALKREVYEETGIDVEFESIISLGHFYPHQFKKSNLYILCKAKALNYDIDVKDKNEIVEAKWIDEEEFLSDDSVHTYSKTIVLSAKKTFGLKKIDNNILKKSKKEFELFFPN